MKQEVVGRVDELQMNVADSQLPPGQHESTDFPRFGLPGYAKRFATPPTKPMLSIAGEVESPCTFALDELGELERCEQRSDFHCVTTWTRRGLDWSGYRLRDVYEQIIEPRARPSSDARWIQMRGMDGCRASLSLEDALAEDVLLADRLNGEPLSLEHGAPLRVVAPAHYGYKSTKHIYAIELMREFVSEMGVKEHPRARAGLEERHAKLPGWLTRRIYRSVLAPYRWWYRRAGRHYGPR